MTWLTALFEAIKAAFVFGTKVTPSEKIQEGKFNIEKPTLTEAQIKRIADERNKLIDEFFGDLKNHPELSITDKVNFELFGEPEQVREMIIKILTDRINEYRNKPIRSFRFKKH